MSEEQKNNDGGLAVEKARPKLAKPPLWKVVLLNDDYTPMEFVVEVLQVFFKLDREQATRVMLHVHQKVRVYAGFLREKLLKQRSRKLLNWQESGIIRFLCKLEKV